MEDLQASCRLRLVVLDIDGTLTDPAGDITPPVQAAVTALLRRDILVVVATGRNLAEMDQVWEIWPQLTRIVYSNGAAITGMGQPLDDYFQGIPAAVARKVYQSAMAADTMPEIYANGKIYVEASRWESGSTTVRNTWKKPRPDPGRRSLPWKRFSPGRTPALKR